MVGRYMRQAGLAVAVITAAACGDIKVRDFDTDFADGASGDCLYGDDTTCDDGDSCTVDICEVNGECTYRPLQNACKIDDTCYSLGDNALGNLCLVCDPDVAKTAWTPVVCVDGNPCTRDECSATSGCLFPADDSLVCDDGEACSVDDRCAAGTCVGTCSCGEDADCPETSDPCLLSACVDGVCEARADPTLNGTPCDDGAFCTVGESCSGGVCGGGQPNTCGTDDSGCQVAACDEDADTCTAEVASDGTSCDDQDPCTDGDVCLEGACAGSAKDCSGIEGPCISASCVAGSCVPTALPGQPCDDGEACTAPDTCDGAGACYGSWVSELPGCSCQEDSDCAGLTAGCNVGRCDTASGQCQSVVELGLPCDDTNPCSYGDACNASGQCAGTPYSCGTVAECQTSTCDGAGGCDQALEPLTCLIDGGEGPTCYANGTLNPANPCESCDVASDVQSWTTAADGSPCGGAQTCVSPSTCTDGQCSNEGFASAGTPCGDAGDTTCDAPDICDGAGTCLPLYTPQGVACDDGDPTTPISACDGDGQCVLGPCSSDADCPDVPPGPCFDEGGSCEPATGACSYATKSLGVPCDDGNPGTLGDACDGAGTCVGQPPCTAAGCGAPLQPCRVTPGICDSGTGLCSYLLSPAGTPCDDGDPSTDAGVCSADGTCLGPTNSPPWLAAIPLVEVPVGSLGTNIPVFAGEGLGVSEAWQVVTVAVVESSNPGLIAATDVLVNCPDLGHGCHGYLALTEPPNGPGTAVITLEVSDGEISVLRDVTFVVSTCSSEPEDFATNGEYTVPDACGTITIKAWGGGGGSADRLNGAPSARGGGGGYAESTLVVLPNDTYQVFIGGGGQSGECITAEAGVGGDGLYQGGDGANLESHGFPGEGSGVGGSGGVGFTAGTDGGPGGWGGGGGGEGDVNAEGGGGGGATVVRSWEGVDVVIAGGGGGGGGGDTEFGIPETGGVGGGGCGQAGGDAPTNTWNLGQLGGGGGGGACLGQTTSAANGPFPVPAAPEGAGVGGANSPDCPDPASGANGYVQIVASGSAQSAGLTVSDSSAFEGDDLVFHIDVMPTETGLPVTLTWSTRELSARAGVDFVAASNTQTLEAGETSFTISISTLVNTSQTGLRLMELVIEGLDNAVAKDPVGLGRIASPDACDAGNEVVTADGFQLLGYTEAYRDADGDSYTGGLSPACALIGAELPAPYSQVPLGPPELTPNATAASEVDYNQPDVDARPWNDESSALEDNGAFAETSSMDLDKHQSRYLVLTGWSANVPDMATVTGIRVTIVKASECGAGGIADAEVRLIDPFAGSENTPIFSPSNLSDPTPWPAAEVPSPTQYGGRDETWGVELTPALVNDPGFGIGIRALPLVNKCRAQVYHATIEIFIAGTVDCDDTDNTVWALRTLYADGDGDGFHVEPVIEGICVGDTLPAPYEQGYAIASKGVDCYDANPQAYPGATGYRTADRGDGSFDYNCDGAETKNANTCFSCICSVSEKECDAYTGTTCAQGAESASYDCTGGNFSCGEAVANGRCRVPRQTSTCSSTTTSFTSGSSTSTIYCSSSFPGYGPASGITYETTNCGCR